MGLEAAVEWTQRRRQNHAERVRVAIPSGPNRWTRPTAVESRAWVVEAAEAPVGESGVRRNGSLDPTLQPSALREMRIKRGLRELLLFRGTDQGFGGAHSAGDRLFDLVEVAGADFVLVFDGGVAVDLSGKLGFL